MCEETYFIVQGGAYSRCLIGWEHVTIDRMELDDYHVDQTGIHSTLSVQQALYLIRLDPGLSSADVAWPKI